MERLQDLGARWIADLRRASGGGIRGEATGTAAASLRTALEWLVGEAAAAHLWVKSHEEVLALAT